MTATLISFLIGIVILILVLYATSLAPLDGKLIRILQLLVVIIFIIWGAGRYLP